MSQLQFESQGRGIGRLDMLDMIMAAHALDRDQIRILIQSTGFTRTLKMHGLVHIFVDTYKTFKMVFQSRDKGLSRRYVTQLFLSEIMKHLQISA